MITKLIQLAIAVLILVVLGYCASLLVAGIILKIIWIILALIGCLIAAKLFGLVAL